MAYDDLSILVGAKFLSTVRDVLQGYLARITRWCKACGLAVNPGKTELVLFTIRYNVPEFRPPLIEGVPLALSDEFKYPDIILDRKLSWRPNV